MVVNNTDRQYNLDWLRVLAIFTVFLFHNARYFDFGPWHVKNNQLSFGIQVFVGILAQWIMPLFFVLSAMSIYHSLNVRKTPQFLWERFKRLFIPFIFGCLIIIAPIQVWIERATQANYSGSFFAFFINDYFKGFYGFGGNFAWMGLHLWYLEFLFLFSLIALPLFLFLRKPKGNTLTNRLAILINKPGAIFLLAIPIVIVELLVNLQPRGAGMRELGGWSLVTYLTVFIIGFLTTTHKDFLTNMIKVRYIALILGIVCVCFVLYFYTIQSASIIFYIIRYTIGGFNMWFWLIAILGFGTYYLNFSNKFLQYAGKALMPFYVLHQMVIVVLGYIMINWKLMTPFKYPILGISSFIAIIVMYELIIKRIKVLRVLFGMKA